MGFVDQALCLFRSHLEAISSVVTTEAQWPSSHRSMCALLPSTSGRARGAASILARVVCAIVFSIVGAGQRAGLSRQLGNNKCDATNNESTLLILGKPVKTGNPSISQPNSFTNKAEIKRPPALKNGGPQLLYPYLAKVRRT